jgi:hypothetical protein
VLLPVNGRRGKGIPGAFRQVGNASEDAAVVNYGSELWPNDGPAPIDGRAGGEVRARRLGPVALGRWALSGVGARHLTRDERGRPKAISMMDEISINRVCEKIPWFGRNASKKN